MRTFNPGGFNKGAKCNIEQQEAYFIKWLEKSLKYAALRLSIKHRKSRQKELLILNSPVNDDSEEDVIDRIEDKNIDVADTVCSNLFIEELLLPLTEKQRVVIKYEVLQGLRKPKLPGN
ncbi:sigma-70 family RNA polymerase sigma factor [Fervidicola ferrireducens]|uniref:sigma-70 family RNA polymerase sigma factor n=1 Tax=Fervidicola ferrireducens TaxID=520764 RepID=UPI0008341B20|nr:sigma-70 family RNA polymerase sigma factor [Fervidicola ferrireducens]